MEIALNKLTSFKNRYYKSKWGAESCRWLIQSIRELSEGAEGVTVKEFEHTVSIQTFNHPCSSSRLGSAQC